MKPEELAFSRVGMNALAMHAPTCQCASCQVERVIVQRIKAAVLAERERCLRESLARLADSVEPSLHKQLSEAMLGRVVGVRIDPARAERERCANIAEGIYGSHSIIENTGVAIARMIREQGSGQ